MKKFRLKKEALPFFDEGLASDIRPLYEWQQQYKITELALEEVEPLYVTYGIKSGVNSHNLNGWGEKQGSHFHFTLHFPSVKFSEHDKFAKGKMTGKLMEKIQHVLNQFYEEFLHGDYENDEE